MNLNFTAPINQRSYGVVGLNLLKELTRLGHKVALFPIGGIEAPPETHPMIREAIERQAEYEPTASSVRLWHQFDLAQHVGWVRHIGFPIFELTEFTSRERHHLLSQDRICVCSSWADDILDFNGICLPTTIVPLGIDHSIFNPTKQPTFGRGPSKTIFLAAGKWEKRKSHDILHEIFRAAFSPKDNVELWMACHNPFLSPEEQSSWERMYVDVLANQVRFITWLPTQKDVAGLMHSVDCGLAISRAEGFNLEALEFLACGKWVIGTNYSGHTEFLDKDNSYLVEIDELESAFDGVWFHGVGQWAKIGGNQIDQIVGYMRNIHKLKREGCLNANAGGVETSKRFTWENTAARLVEAIG